MKKFWYNIYARLYFYYASAGSNDQPVLHTFITISLVLWLDSVSLVWLVIWCLKNVSPVFLISVFPPRGDVILVIIMLNIAIMPALYLLLFRPSVRTRIVAYYNALSAEEQRANNKLLPVFFTSFALIVCAAAATYSYESYAQEKAFKAINNPEAAAQNFINTYVREAKGLTCQAKELTIPLDTMLVTDISENDTVVNNHNYKICALLSRNNLLDYNYYIRAEGNTVRIISEEELEMGDTTDHILFDFGLKKGDTVRAPGICPPLLIESIDTLHHSIDYTFSGTVNKLPASDSSYVLFTKFVVNTVSGFESVDIHLYQPAIPAQNQPLIDKDYHFE